MQPAPEPLAGPAQDDDELYEPPEPSEGYVSEGQSSGLGSMGDLVGPREADRADFTDQESDRD